MKEKLRRSKEQLAQGFDAFSLVIITIFFVHVLFIRLVLNDALFIGKAKIERVSHDLKVKYGVLESARGTVLTLLHFGFFVRIGSCMTLTIGIVFFLFAVGKESCGTARDVLSQSYLHTKLGACEYSLFFMFVLFLRSQIYVYVGFLFFLVY